jgi:KDO2-lipid IV(A) lauroyltransferase
MIWFLGWMWWLVIPIRKGLAIDNYHAAFPDRPPSDLRRSVGEIAWGYVELAMGRRATVHGAQHVTQGGLCLAGHGGAWDLALISVAHHIPVTIFVKTPANPLAAWWIRRMRERAGLELLSPAHSAVAAYRALKRGRLVVFVQDQRHNSGIPVPFFGRPAWTSRGFGVLTARTQAPVFGAWQHRDAITGEHHLHIEPLVLEDRTDDAITAASQQFYERKIKERPHSWLWLHDRWRSLEGTV